MLQICCSHDHACEQPLQSSLMTIHCRWKIAMAEDLNKGDEMNATTLNGQGIKAAPGSADPSQWQCAQPFHHDHMVVDGILLIRGFRGPSADNSNMPARMLSCKRCLPGSGDPGQWQCVGDGHQQQQPAQQRRLWPRALRPHLSLWKRPSAGMLGQQRPTVP